MRKKSLIPTILTSVVVAIGLLAIANKQRGVGSMNDPEVAAELRKMGVPTV